MSTHHVLIPILVRPICANASLPPARTPRPRRNICSKQAAARRPTPFLYACGPSARSCMRGAP